MAPRKVARLEMRLAAVVLHGASGACVCEPEPTSATPPRASLGGPAGAAALIAAAEAAAEQRRSQQASQAPKTFTPAPTPPMHR